MVLMVGVEMPISMPLSEFSCQHWYVGKQSDCNRDQLYSGIKQ